MEKTTVSFPGLGIGEFSVDPVAFRFNPFGLFESPIEVRWYGIIICLGMILACVYVYLRARQIGLTLDDVLDIALFIIPCGVIGARLYYVIMKPEIFKTFYDVIAIWEGGLAIYGGVIGGGIALLIVSKLKKLKTGQIFDMVAPAVMIGQILGRWGNFFNGEAHGTETDIFCRMGLFEGGEMIFVHPTFLYESLWNLLGFILINAFWKKKKFDWQIFLEYISWYGFGRMFIEGLRTDSLYLGPWRVSQLVGFFCFVIGVFVMIFLFLKSRKYHDAETVEYAGVYSRLTRKTEQKRKVTEEEEEKIIGAIIKKEANEDGDDGDDRDGADGVDDDGKEDVKEDVKEDDEEDVFESVARRISETDENKNGGGGLN